MKRKEIHRTTVPINNSFVLLPCTKYYLEEVEDYTRGCTWQLANVKTTCRFGNFIN